MTGLVRTAPFGEGTFFGSGNVSNRPKLSSSGFLLDAPAMEIFRNDALSFYLPDLTMLAQSVSGCKGLRGVEGMDA